MNIIIIVTFLQILESFPTNNTGPGKIDTDLTRIQKVLSLWHQAKLNPEIICHDDQKAKFFTDKAFLLNMGKAIGKPASNNIRLISFLQAASSVACSPLESATLPVTYDSR